MTQSMRTLTLILACGSLLPFGQTAALAAGKNIALIITDNQSWYDVGCYGNTVIQTLHMDQLAAEGVRFRQAFATVASCGASRAVIYSGVLTHRNGQYAHPHREHNQQIREDIVTVFEALQERGYRTALMANNTSVLPKSIPSIHCRPESLSQAPPKAETSSPWRKWLMNSSATIHRNRFSSHCPWEIPTRSAATVSLGELSPAIPPAMSPSNTTQQISRSPVFFRTHQPFENNLRDTTNR